MRSIRGRLFLSLVLVMCFSITVTIYFFSHNTFILLRDQAEIQLELQLEKALEVLNGGQISDLDNTVFELRFTDHLFSAEYVVLDHANKVVASSDPSWIGSAIPSGSNGTTAKIKINGVNWLYTVDAIDSTDKRLMLLTPVDPLRGYNRYWISLTVASLAASTAFIFMIGMLFIWNTTRPLKQLKRAVAEFQPYKKTLSMPSSESKSEIGQLMHTFQSMADRIRRHHEHQTEFLHRVSHELRTPLMSIQGYAQAIKDDVVPQVQAIQVIQNESQRLIQMVERLLQLSRLEGTSDEWPITTVDLREMAEQAVQIITPIAGDQHVAVTVEGAEALEADIPAEQVFQVLLNLVHNAVRHAESRVRITAKDLPGGWMFQVDDDGKGVPEELREEIFVRFFKGPTGGMGLGLTICREICERIGATIECEQSAMGGASFRVQKG